MDENPSCSFQIFPAPYLENSAHLISSAEGARHRAFYRAGSDSLRGASRDFFSAGDFVLHEVPWSSIGGASDWRRIGDRLGALECSGGPLVGYLSYESGFAYEQDKWGMLQHPGSGFAWRFFELPCWYEADHFTRTARVCAMNHADGQSIEFLKEVVEKAEKNRTRSIRPQNDLVSLKQVAELGEFSQTQYSQTIEQILDDIGAGRFYELNLTQRFRTRSHISSADVFNNLFTTLVPRRGFYCDFEDEAVVSASPELYLKKTGNRISTRPIKGSMRGATSPAELEKLTAEHVMVVDLARNDLGRVSDRNWVSVEELQVLGRFGGLDHLESLVAGFTSLGWQDVISRTFPPASITGMPKVQVVQSIAEYEKSCRGVYTGACGWVWPDGDFDFNVAIRTLTASRDGRTWKYEMGAGGAIVADSKPLDEYMECLSKAQPLISAVGIE